MTVGKYDSLRAYLAAQPAGLRALTVAFSEVEAVLDVPLPRSARVHRPWWSNSGHVQAEAWQAAGWEVDSVDLAAEWVTFTRHSDGKGLPRESIEPVYPFNEPGEPIVIHEGEITLEGIGHGPGRLIATMDGDLDVRWEASLPSQVLLGNLTIGVDRPDLGRVDVPAMVNHSTGRGRIDNGSVGTGTEIVRAVVHWVNLPGIYPSEPLADGRHAWAGYWAAHGGGWTMTFTSRPDLGETWDKMKRPRRLFAVTQIGELCRTGGSPFDKEAAENALDGWQVALSVALGRWVAPALPVGFDCAGYRSYEQWAAWRCDEPYGCTSWWDTHNGDDLKEFIALFLNAWFDSGHDLIWYLSHSLIAANHSSTTVEARIMLALATVDYLSWVKNVLSERRTKTQQAKLRADECLRELLEAATIPGDIPRELPALAQLASKIGKTPQNGPTVLMHLRNLLVHPKDAGEPYRIQHLISDAWQLAMQYVELLLLHELGYRGQYGPRYPSNRWAHDRQPVPWTGQSPTP